MSVALVLAGACSGDDEPAAASSSSVTTTTPEATAPYADDDAWLCRGGAGDICDGDLDATAVSADGTTAIEHVEPAADPAIDCFYVYPTVSNDRGANSDREPGDEERDVVVAQAARFSQVCRVYAPVYRQFTLAELGRWFTGESPPNNGRDEAYADVVDAWHQYLERDNAGRGVILLGHSQGAMHLTRLLDEEIAPSQEHRALLVSAMLFGNSVYASDTPSVPPCDAPDQTGCIVSYSSFRDDAPPPAGAFFARARGDERAICTNPAALGSGDEAELHPYVPESRDWGADVTTPSS